MFSVVPNIVLVPNMTQNANTERRTQTLLISVHDFYNFRFSRQIDINGFTE